MTLKAGFLQDDGALPTATSAAALDAAYADALEEARRLRAIEDPEETPFVSRYEERDVLAKVARQAAANAAAEPAGSSEARRATAIGAILNGMLGRNFMETEEPSAAQPKLEAAIDALEGISEEAAAHVEVLNSLGVLWANRGEAEKSLELLKRARAAHSAAKEDAASRGTEAAQRLEDQCTLTTYYLAQAYGNLGQRTESAALCHETMRRQLARRGLSGGGECARRVPHACLAAPACDQRGGCRRALMLTVARHGAQAGVRPLAMDAERMRSRQVLRGPRLGGNLRNPGPWTLEGTSGATLSPRRAVENA